MRSNDTMISNLHSYISGRMTKIIRCDTFAPIVKILYLGNCMDVSKIPDWDEWIEWIVSRYNSSYATEKIPNAFKTMKEFPEFIFLLARQDFASREGLISSINKMYMSKKLTPHLMNKYMTLLDLARQNHDEMRVWWFLDGRRRSRKHKVDIFSYSHTFDLVSDRCFAKIYGETGWYDFSDVIAGSIPLLLRIVYGDSVTIEAMNRITESADTQDFITLIELTARWDELEEYPLEWIKNLIHSEVIEGASR